MKQALNDFMTYFEFLKLLVRRDLKKKYYRSFFGVFWTMLNPLLLMILMTIIFSTIFKRQIDFYPIYWFCGHIIFEFVTSASRLGMNAIIANAGLIKKINVPTYFFVLSQVILHFTTTIISLIPFFAITFVLGVPFTPYMLLTPIIFIFPFIFTLGLTLITAAYGTSLRDLPHLYGIFTRLWMYATPIFYPIDIIPDSFRFLWDLNPLYIFIEMFRNIILDGQMPSEKFIIIATVYSLLTLCMGITVFKEKKDSFLLYI